jgi:trehalose/maltose hydrolase-like predicted phosphorylase
MQHPESSSIFQSAGVVPASQQQQPGGRTAAPMVSHVVPLAELARDPSWLLVDEGFTLAREHEVESLFAIANGYVGNRGSLAEGSSLSAPATFASGVFELDSRPGAVPGFFVLPDWTGIRAWVEGQPLSMEHGEVLEHRRILDLWRGVLWRQWRHRDPNGRITRLTAFRLASLADRHLLVQSAVFTPENYTGEIRLETCIKLPPDVQSSPPPEEWKTRRSATRPNVLPLALRSPGTHVTVAFGAASQLLANGNNAARREIDIDERYITERFWLDVEMGASYRLDRIVSIYTSRDNSEPIEAAVAHVNRFLPAGVQDAVAAHVREWESRWRDADVQIEGDEALQRALRFAEYHLISSANPEDGRVSIGARALSGEAYKGHVFWDTEIYMVPFYSFTHPASARALLTYRYHTLPAAREKARAAGYRGIMYPWESADTGEETTPRFVIALNGEVIAVRNGDLENHITADVAYAVWQYWNVTADDEFFLKAGAEIMLESARMWASRGQVEADGLYHIRHVIGPDEYHEEVDDNAFTNIMAGWNMRRGLETAQVLQQRWPERWRELANALQITEEELESWSRLPGLIYTSYDPQTRLFEQFSGYFKKEQIDLAAYEPRHSAMDVILGHDRIQQTNIVKQADVVMAMYLLWDEFPAEIREANFRYYEPRTGHGSSLSPSMHALVAARMGDVALAEKYLRQAAEIDLGNNMGNAAGGVHAAAIGGLWQAMIFGFAGLEVRAEGVAFNPHLLPHWMRLTLPLQFRGRKLRVIMEPDKVSVQIEQGGDLVIAVVGGEQCHARPQQRYRAERHQGKWAAWQEL